MKMFVRVDMNIFNLINEKYKGNISLLYDKESNYKRLIAYSGDTNFNYRLYFYPIFKADKYYFDELQVPSLMQKYEADIDRVYVYDDGVVKGFIKIEETYDLKIRK